MAADFIYGRPFGFLVAGCDVKGIINGAKVMAVVHHAVALMPSLFWLLRNSWLGHLMLPKISEEYGSGFLMAVG